SCGPRIPRREGGCINETGYYALPVLARRAQFCCGFMAVLVVGFNGAALQAESIILTAVADTTLIETAPDNNLGGALIVNAGTTQNFTRNRGLFRFDPTGQIPTGSHITKVDFVVVISGQPKDGYTSSSFGDRKSTRL